MIFVPHVFKSGWTAPPLFPPPPSSSTSPFVFPSNCSKEHLWIDPISNIQPNQRDKQQIMSFLPPALDFPKSEEEVCEKWANESTFHTQNRLSEERGDEVRTCLLVCLESSSISVYRFVCLCICVYVSVCPPDVLKLYQSRYR
jgi:hypothetical protein